MNRTKKTCNIYRVGSHSILCKRIIGIAIEPALAGFRGGDDRVFAAEGVFRRMPVRRTVTAKRGVARLTSSQMHPAVADLHTVFAFPT